MTRRNDAQHREQRTLWGNEIKPVTPIDPNIDARDVPRVTGHSKTILQRLQRGPATSGELAAISLKYTSRISDLRKAGYVIAASRLASGEWRYTLAD